MTLAIGVDVGGTKVAAGVVDEDGRIIAKLKRSTPAASPARTELAIADAVTELLAHDQVAGRRVGAIGLGAAGFVDSARATMLFAPNLAWRDEPLKQRFRRGHDFFLRTLSARDPIQICDKNFQRIFCH